MKLLLKSILFMLVLVLVASAGCDMLPVGDSGSEYSAEKQAVDTLAEFSIVNELATLNLLEIFSDGFTRPLFSEQVTISYDDYATVFSLMSELSAYEESVTAALSIIVPPELAYNYQVVYAGFAPPGADDSLQAVSPGLFDSFVGFFGFLGDAGKRSRERIVAIAQNANESQKQQMYEELRPEWKNQAQNYNEWFQKLQNGDFDSKASQIHSDFTQNIDLDFYTDAAQDKGTLPAQIVYEEGGEAAKRAGEFYADVATTVIGKALPGFEKGVEKVKDLNDKAEKFKKYTDTYYRDGVSGVVGEAFKERLQNMEQNAATNTFGDEVGNAIVNFVNNMTPDTPERARITVRNEEQEQNYGNIIAFNQDDGAPGKMYVYVGDSGSPADFAVPEGEYLVVAADDTGDDCGQNEHVRANAGGEVVVTMSPVTPAGENEIQKMETAREKLQNTLAGIDNGQQQGNVPATTTAAATKTSVATTTPPVKKGNPNDGWWLLTTSPETKNFTTDDGRVFNNYPAEIIFQISGGKIKTMDSPIYTYLVSDFEIKRGSVTLGADGKLEILVLKDRFEGYLSGNSGSGTFEQYYDLDGKEYRGCWGSWKAERIGDYRGSR